MSYKIQIVALISTLILTQCNSSKNTEVSMTELMQTDLNFSEMSKNSGMKKAFLAYASEEGILLRPNRMPIEGKTEITAFFNEFSDEEFILTWEPYGGDISASGDIGFTYGIYTYEQDTIRSKGTYTSVWKKEDGGNWKFVLDTGNPGLGD